jgi:alkyl hydroperoxide reductase subunit AhpC
MKRIGTPSLNFRAPALVNGQLTYLGSMQFIGHWTALCFLPYVGIVEPDFLDHQADRFDRLDTTLLIISSGTRPLHRVWLDRPTTPRTPLLYDPLGRLHRAFGVAPAQIPVRCQTFLIDRDALLRFHLIHDFTDRGLDALHEIVMLSQAQSSGGPTMAHGENEATREAITTALNEQPVAPS